MKDKK